MNLSLYKLRKKLNTDKSGQGSLVAVILASVIGTIIISSTTQWFLSMNKTMDGTNDRLEAMTIAMSEWQRLEHMSLDELEVNRENYKTPYDVGDKFKVGISLGEQGYFDKGKCNSLTGDYATENANCFKDTTMTVYDKDGKAMYTTRSLPLFSQSSDVYSALPIGSIIWWYSEKIPENFLLCNGQSTKNFPKLAAIIGDNVPNIIGKFIYAAGYDEQLGNIYEDSTFTMTFDKQFPVTYIGAYDATNSTGYIATPFAGADGHAVNAIIKGNRTFSGKYKPMHIACYPIIKAK